MLPYLCMVLFTSALLCRSTAGAEPATNDGLVPVKVKRFDEAYKRPDANLKGYGKILFKPVTVEFSKRWDPSGYRTFGLKAEEVEDLRNDLAKIAEEQFRKALSEGGYSLVESAETGVLELEAKIVDLYMNAPAELEVGTRTYVRAFGEMQLVLTLRDAVTGATLFRAIDKQRGQENDPLEWATPAWNRSEARRALAGWARQFKKALDDADVS